MLDARKAKILEKVVAEHIETGQPVGSSHIVRDEEIDVSPATVRSDMAALEREGYLSHPHTSAGRVPTDAGYRFFVDHLDEDAELDPRREEKVHEFFARAHGELERMLRNTSQLLSQLTDYAAVVVAPTHEEFTIASASLTRIANHVALLVVVLSNGIVEKHTIEIAPQLTEAAIDAANVVFREHLPGQTLGHLAPRKLSGQADIDTLVDECLHVLGARISPQNEVQEVYVGGTARMAEQFSAVDTVREVLSILEESFVVVSLLHDVLSQGQSVSIGAEHHLDSLAECSLVVAPYRTGQDSIGTIGVLGPTRMNYAEALAAVGVVSKQLGRQLSSG